MRLFIAFSLLLLFQLQSPVLACRCLPLTQENAKERIDQADLVVQGEYIRTIGADKEVNRNQDSHGEGYTVLFRITKKYKGRVKSDTLAIYQTSNSCTRIFRKGERYILVAREIDGFLLSEDKEGKASNEGPQKDKDDNITMGFPEKPALKYWKKIQQKYLTVDVNLCTSFRLETEEGQLLQRQF